MDALLREAVVGRDAMDVAGAWRAVRNNGRVGIAAMPFSAVDIALWDLKARLLDLPLFSLIGMAGAPAGTQVTAPATGPRGIGNEDASFAAPNSRLGVRSMTVPGALLGQRGSALSSTLTPPGPPLRRPSRTRRSTGGSMRAARRLTSLVAFCGLGACLAAAPAPADIREYPADPSATPLGRAMEAERGLVRRGVFSALPPSSKPAAVSTTRLAGFPRRGSSFAILSSGNARYADDANDEGDLGTEARGPSIRGARDVAIMRLDLRVPRGANCLSFDFRYLSEEFPEFVDEVFNDAFIAELGVSDWDASSKVNPTIQAPNNFAVNRRGDPIRVNALGNISVSAARARGTTYDAATRLLRASTRVRPGLRRLYLSIFDQGDRIYDSAVFLDNLRVTRRERCRSGIARVPS